MKSALVKVGDELHAVIPDEVTADLDFNAGDIDVSIEGNRIVISTFPKKNPREGWAESAAAIAAAGDDELVLGDFPNDFDDKEWTW